MPQQQFKGYSEDQMKRIASKLGHTGDLNTFDSYLGANPKALGKYNTLKDAAVKRFSRGGVAVSGYDAGGAVQEAFQSILGRQAGTEGANFYTDQINSGAKTLEQVRAELAGSTEGKQRADAVAAGNTDFQRYVAPSAQVEGVNYNTTTESVDALGRTGDNTAADAAAIQNIYQNQVGRAAGTQGADYYAEQMAKGVNLDTINANVGTSTEGQQFAETGQQRYVSQDNQVSTPGIDYFKHGADGTTERVRVGADPIEYRTTDQPIDQLGRIGDNTAADTAAIQTLYQNQTGRAGDTAGTEYYADLLAGGTNLDTIREQINSSEEGVAWDETGQQLYVSPEDQVAGVDYRVDPAIEAAAKEKAAADKVIADKIAADKVIADAAAKIIADAKIAADKIIADAAAAQAIIDAQIAKDIAAGLITADEAAAAAKTAAAKAAAAKAAAQAILDAAAAKVISDAQIAKDIADSNTATSTIMADSTALVNDSGITYTEDQTIGQTTLNQSLEPELATGAKTKGTSTTVAADQLMDVTTGQLDNSATGLPQAAGGTAVASGADAITASAVTKQAANTASDASVKTMLSTVDAASGTIDDDNKVTAQEDSTSSVSALNAAQTSATVINGAPTRNLDGNEIVNGVADAQSAAAFTEQIKAAQADPSAKSTVQGQLASLMTSFDEGKTPAWAAGAMRNVTAQMAARGIGSSSMAGQALIQAALETALPIATADAQTFATFELTNLSNRQQRVMLSAQQRATFMGQEFDQDFQARVFNSTRIGEIANTNFTATQQIAIENAQVANTVNLANLSNTQANVMAEAAALSQLDITSLNNRQQAQVQNAQNFLDMDLANLSNTQQATLFKAQQRSASIMSDAAADNARNQFNATSENQVDQFFANLKSTVSQFNASQKTAVSQSNSGESTAVSKFNAEMRNQRDQFNATNSIVVNQSNAQWRRTIATSDTATINRVNEINAKAMLDISNTAYNNLWQERRDEMDWGYKIQEGAAERFNAIVRTTIAAEADIEVAGAKSDGDFWSSLGSLVGTIAGEYIKTNVTTTG